MTGVNFLYDYGHPRVTRNIGLVATGLPPQRMICRQNIIWRMRKKFLNLGTKLQVMGKYSILNGY
jgi:hypothetical protein